MNQQAVIQGLVIAALTTGAACCSCNNECSFSERCAGHVRELCGHPDQVVGRRVRREECSSSATCVQVTNTATACVDEPVTPCDRATYEPSCVGDTTTNCGPYGFSDTAPGYVISMPCRADSGVTCAVIEDATRPGHKLATCALK